MYKRQFFSSLDNDASEIIIGTLPFHCEMWSKSNEIVIVVLKSEKQVFKYTVSTKTSASRSAFEIHEIN